MINTSYILGVKLNFGYTYDTAVEKISEMMVKKDLCRYICTTNSEFIADAQYDRIFKDIINGAELSLPDGSGVVIAKKYLDSVESVIKPPRSFRLFLTGIWTGGLAIFKPEIFEPTIAGKELVERLLALCERRGASIFLLGGRYRDVRGKFLNDGRDLAKDTAEVIKKSYPRINIIGATSSYGYKEEDDTETIKYITSCMQINNVEHIDLLLVAYNHINQEKWIVRNASKIPARVSIGVGGTLDYIIGYQKEDPQVFIKLHLRWLYRLFTQPWRIMRILKAIIYFPWQVYLSSVNRSNSVQ